MSVPTIETGWGNTVYKTGVTQDKTLRTQNFVAPLTKEKVSRLEVENERREFGPDKTTDYKTCGDLIGW